MRKKTISTAGVLLCVGLALVQEAQAQPVATRLEDRVDFRGASVLRGRVRFSDGRAAAGVAVVVEMTDSWKNAFGNKSGVRTKHGAYTRAGMHLVRASTVTKTDGSYEFRGLGAAAYDVRAKVRQGERVLAGPEGFAATPLIGVLMSNDKTTRAEDLVLGQGEIVSGRVVDALTGAGLRGLSVGADGVGEARSVRAAVDVTDAEGRFSLRLPPGRYEVGVMTGNSSYEGWKFEPTSARRLSDGATVTATQSAGIYSAHRGGRDYVFTTRAGAIVEATGAQVLERGGYHSAVLDAREGESATIIIKAQPVELHLAPRER